MSIGSKEAKHSAHSAAIFQTYGRGICSNNDDFVYDFESKALAKRAKCMVEAYGLEQARWEKAGRPENVEGLIKVDATVLKWIRRTKKSLARGLEVKFDTTKIRSALYRPFSRRFHYFERIFNEDIYQFADFLPARISEKDNQLLCLTDLGSEKHFMDDEEYIVRLIGQVITVSLETLKIVNSLPKIEFAD